MVPWLVEDDEDEVFQEEHGAMLGHIQGFIAGANHGGSGLGFRERLIKGYIAEKLVEQLFTTNGFFLFPYGLEHQTPTYHQFRQLVGITRGVDRVLSRCPDFLVLDTFGQELVAMEVKYRRNGLRRRCDERQWLDDHPFPESLVVLVCRDGFLCADLRTLMDAAPDQVLMSLMVPLEEHSRFRGMNHDEEGRPREGFQGAFTKESLDFFTDLIQRCYAGF